jgi:hypothetical protein
MYYSITVKHPKSKIKQYDMPGPRSINELSNDEFIEVIKNYTQRQLVSKINSLKLRLVDIRWEPLSPEKANLITQFYSESPIYFADINTDPGDNGTVNQSEGIYRAKDIPKIENQNQAYIALGINPMPFFYVNSKNYFIPNYEINPQYKIKFQNPDAQIYDIILQQLIQKQILKYPLASTAYNDTKPEFYELNGIIYKIPHYNTIRYNANFKSLLDIYYKYSESEEKLYRFNDNLNAWEEFLNSIPEIVRSEKTYDQYIITIEPKKTSSFPGTKNTKVPVYQYENAYYYVPTYESLRKTNLFSYWNSIIKESKPILNSLADETFRQLKVENPFNEIINDGLTFRVFFNCNKDPRWNKFIAEKYFKIPENANEDKIKKIKEEIRIKSPKLFLFSSIKPVKKIVIDENGKKKHCFNLSNDYFENVPDGEWKRCISALSNDPCKIYEFVIWNDSMNPEIWKGESRTPTERGDIKLTPFQFLHDRGMNEDAYSIDAVLVNDNNEIQYIIEFDGTDHFYSRRKDGNPTGKIVSDQVKNRFAREHNIPCIRIPGFRNQRDLNFQSDFKKYVINLIRQKYNLPPLQQESETVNPAIYNNSKSPN